MTFRQRYLAGETDFEEIFDLTDQWSLSDETCTLRQYLGLTPEEEDIWISDSDEALEEFMEKEKKRCIFFTDLDGTLLTDQKTLTPGTISALNEFLEAGNIISLSTGRARASIVEQARILGLNRKNCYAICYNGAQIFDLSTGECLFNDSIPLELVRKCFNAADAFGIHIQTYTENEVITEKDSPELITYCNILKIMPKIVPDVIEELQLQNLQPPKILAIDTIHPERVSEFRRYLEELTDGQLSMFLSNPSYLEIVSPTVNKGNALRRLCSHLDIPISHSVAAGDAENDAPMIKAAGIGVCMINGVDMLKKSADYITHNDNNHNGAVEALTLTDHL